MHHRSTPQRSERHTHEDRSHQGLRAASRGTHRGSRPAVSAARRPARPAGGGADDGNADDIEAALEARRHDHRTGPGRPPPRTRSPRFEKEYPNVKVNVVNAGTNNDEYTKLQNAIKAGSGAPDVAQIEYYALPQFALTDSLVDLDAYGFGDFEDDYTAGTWSSVNLGDGIYGLPQDSGPMALFYNKAVFDQYGIAVPTTWDEYVAAAKTAARRRPRRKYITNDTGDAGFTTSMIWQAGGQPYRPTNGTDVTINLQDEGSKKWADTWNQLVEGDLVSPIPAWSDEWYKGLGDGSIATL